MFAVKLVGKAGFEPATSRFQTESSDQAELLPEKPNLSKDSNPVFRNWRPACFQQTPLRSGAANRTRTDISLIDNQALSH